MPLDQARLLKLLTYAAQNGVSDVHFRAGFVPAFRLRGDLVNVNVPAYSDADLHELAEMLLKAQPQRSALENLREVDGSFDIQGLCRFRYNIFRWDGKLGIVMRLIPLHVPTLADLGLPSVVSRISEIERGLVLVTGATGMGKSTTLAAMVDHLNANQTKHVITIEDPIEFVHPQKRSRVTQREVGRDTDDFASALRAALRQDPDAILVGELRDCETLDIALKAAETGHTVFSTVHTTDAAKSVGRIISMYPLEDQGTVRIRLADCLRATISQRLLKRADGRGRALAQEIMIVNAAIQECIVNPNETHRISHIIENGRDILGTQTFNQHLRDLYERKVITLDAAKRASSNASDFERAIHFTDATSAKSGVAHFSKSSSGIGREPANGLLAPTTVRTQTQMQPQAQAQGQTHAATQALPQERQSTAQTLAATVPISHSSPAIDPSLDPSPELAPDPEGAVLLDMGVAGKTSTRDKDKKAA